MGAFAFAMRQLPDPRLACAAMLLVLFALASDYSPIVVME